MEINVAKYIKENKNYFPGWLMRENTITNNLQKYAPKYGPTEFILSVRWKWMYFDRQTKKNHTIR